MRTVDDNDVGGQLAKCNTEDTFGPNHECRGAAPDRAAKLLPLPAQAEAIRTAAAAAKKTIWEYVSDLHAGAWTPAELLQFDALCEVDRHLAGIPESVRKLDADLGRLSVAWRPFTADPGKALPHHSAINEALRVHYGLQTEIMANIVQEKFAPKQSRGMRRSFVNCGRKLNHVSATLSRWQGNAFSRRDYSNVARSFDGPNGPEI